MPRPPTLYERVKPDDENNKPPHSQYNINYRQVAAQTSLVSPLYSVPQSVTTSSSSYDYWWPYPPGGVSTTSSSPSPNSPIISSTLADSLPVAILSSLSSDAFSSSTDSFADPTSSTSVPISTSTLTSSASQSIISINAATSSQTAASTFTAYPKNSQNQNQSQSSNNSKSEVYLIPIFVVLGIILGSVVAWIGWGCITRKPRIRDFDEDSAVGRKKTGRRPRRSELEVGPAYCSSMSERNNLLEDSGDGHDKNTVASQSAMFSWRALDADGVKDEEPQRDYLSPPKLPSKRSRPKSLGRMKRQQELSRTVTSKTATSVSVYSQVGEEDETFDEDITDNMSHLDEFDPRTLHTDDKSAIATPNSSSSTRVISLSRRRPNHTRTDSDSHLDIAGTPVGEPRDLKKNLLSRTATARTQNSTRTAQTGFRMIEGSPLPTPAVSISDKSQTSGIFFWGNNEPEDRVTRSKPKSRGRSNSHVLTPSSDSYTAFPVREPRGRSNSPAKKSVVSRQAINQRQVSARDKVIEEYYGSSLPQSPPQVTCPKLESSLCFTPTLT
ncbi:MAG: hypothetical protein NXY57DRAFT_959615 [Lentinula lateritia]|uniref:Uncharacterized protein n=1 Tax=Lentinula lateritia TaxID=40482 RepID=A0ABQ8VXM6_9AGAR|nr:MAG: hypothetical protein NXY57DRAFT_959615 [Lentinula lateritia]KAJ4501142.1 hypothetical protein C8R41DRAFT_287167 [Lentinula lateritia]